MAQTCRGVAGVQTKNFRIKSRGVKTFCVDVAQNGAALDSQYVEFKSAGNATDYYLWYNLTDGASVDPAPGGTGIQVDITTNSTPAQIAAATAAAVDANADFNALVVASRSSAYVIKTRAYEDTLDPVSSDVTLLDPFVEQQGFERDLGLTGQGGFTIDLDVSRQELTCDQTGDTVVAETITGITPTMSVTFKEFNTENFRALLQGGVGGVCTVDGVDYSGIGTDAIGRNTASVASRISLCPIGGGEEITFMLATPTISSLDFPSNENCSFEVEFKGLRDEFSKCPESDIIHFGDALVV